MAWSALLDTETEKAVIEAIEKFQGDKTMIIIAHRLSTIEHCDIIYRVEDGGIVREKWGYNRKPQLLRHYRD